MSFILLYTVRVLVVFLLLLLFLMDLAVVTSLFWLLSFWLSLLFSVMVFCSCLCSCCCTCNYIFLILFLSLGWSSLHGHCHVITISLLPALVLIVLILMIMLAIFVASVFLHYCLLVVLTTPKFCTWPRKMKGSTLLRRSEYKHPMISLARTEAKANNKAPINATRNKGAILPRQRWTMLKLISRARHLASHRWMSHGSKSSIFNRKYNGNTSTNGMGFPILSWPFFEAPEGAIILFDSRNPRICAFGRLKSLVNFHSAGFRIASGRISSFVRSKFSIFMASQSMLFFDLFTIAICDVFVTFFDDVKRIK